MPHAKRFVHFYSLGRVAKVLPDRIIRLTLEFVATRLPKAIVFLDTDIFHRSSDDQFRGRIPIIPNYSETGARRALKTLHVL